MAFREKIAWLSLVTMLIAYGMYFTLVARAMQGGGEPSTLSMLLTFAGVTIVQAIVVTVAAIIIAATGPREAQAPADERDRSIARRGASVAYYVLMVGMVLVGIVMPFSKHGWQIINAALVALVLAETVRHGLVLLSYRRGWHG